MWACCDALHSLFDTHNVSDQSICVHKHVVFMHAMYALKGMQKVTQRNPSYIHAQDLRRKLSD